MYPHTITVINTVNNRGVITYYPTVVTRVHYQDKQGVRTGTTEHFTDNQGYVQIPYKINYLPYPQWLQLSDKTGKWTLQRDDFIVKGITTETDPKKINELRTIDSYEDVDYAKFIPKHFGVTLK